MTIFRHFKFHQVFFPQGEIPKTFNSWQQLDYSKIKLKKTQAALQENLFFATPFEILIHSVNIAPCQKIFFRDTLALKLQFALKKRKHRFKKTPFSPHLLKSWFAVKIAPFQKKKKSLLWNLNLHSKSPCLTLWNLDVPWRFTFRHDSLRVIIFFKKLSYYHV